MIPTQIQQVLSTIRRFDVPALLMGGQACVLYGAAEYSRDLDLAVFASALEDLVAAKKTQRDKDWPMLRRLVDASYANANDADCTSDQIEFWLEQLRSPEFVLETVQRFPAPAARSLRPAVIAARGGGDVAAALSVEQAREMAIDRTFGNRCVGSWRHCVTPPDASRMRRMRRVADSFCPAPRSIQRRETHAGLLRQP